MVYGHSYRAYDRMSLLFRFSFSIQFTEIKGLANDLLLITVIIPKVYAKISH